MKAWIVRTPSGHIVPADEESRETLKTVPEGVVIKCEFFLNRDYQKHKKFFAFLKATFDMQEHFTEMDNYRTWLTMKAGWYDTIVAPNGRVIFQPKSIAFDKMEQDDFNKLYSTCIDVFLRELGKGITQDQLLRVVEF